VVRVCGPPADASFRRLATGHLKVVAAVGDGGVVCEEQRGVVDLSRKALRSVVLLRDDDGAVWLELVTRGGVRRTLPGRACRSRIGSGAAQVTMTGGMTGGMGGGKMRRGEQSKVFRVRRSCRGQVRLNHWTSEL
jgi:hypothetical protein